MPKKVSFGSIGPQTLFRRLFFSDIDFRTLEQTLLSACERIELFDLAGKLRLSTVARMSYADDWDYAGDTRRACRRVVPYRYQSDRSD